MKTRNSTLANICAQLLAFLWLSAGSPAQADSIDFTPEQWDLTDAEVVQHLGRTCIHGSAVLNEVEFENGIIEVDIALDGSRSYPGIVFRRQSEDDYERFYVRPHRAGLYPDALQYTPVCNGVACWQLYHGPGFTAGAELPCRQWIHLTVEIHASQARVFLDHADQPALIITELKHGVSEGAIGLMGPKNASAYFSRFSYRHDDSLEFPEPTGVESPPGTIVDWEISRSYKTSLVNREQYPRFYYIFGAEWQKVTSEPSGLVNISRLVKRSGQDADCVFARAIVHADEKRRIKLEFGYSDEAHLFLNGHPVFWGNSTYRSRDRSFVGIVGLNDAVYLDLQKGLNEIFLMVSESFGGWGLMARSDSRLDLPHKQHEKVQVLWETPQDFLTPESVLYDPAREVLYVSSFDRFFGRRAEPSGFISKVSLNGDIEELKWVTGLTGPCGMTIQQDKLFVVERGNLVEIDIETGAVEHRYPIPDSTFLNDIASGPSGRIYISDTFPATPDNQAAIYAYQDGAIEIWLDDDVISRANGLFMHDGRLLVGNTGDGTLKSIDLDTKLVSTITCLGAGVVDGIRVDTAGNYLVSHWEGQTYRVSPDGQVVEILDTLPTGMNSADFEYIKDRRMLIIPTFMDNRVVAYALSP